MSDTKRLASALTHTARIFGEITAKDVKRLTERYGLRLVPTRAGRMARCARCGRRLTSQVFTVVGESGEWDYGPKCYQIMKEGQVA